MNLSRVVVISYRAARSIRERLSPRSPDSGVAEVLPPDPIGDDEPYRHWNQEWNEIFVMMISAYESDHRHLRLHQYRFFVVRM